MDVCLCGWNVSTPDTLQHSFYYDSCVDISVCVCLFWNATLNLFGQSETVWDKGFCFWLTDHPAIYFPSIHFLFLFYKYPPICFGGPDHYLKLLNKDTFFFFFFFLLISLSTALCLTLPPPSCLKHSSGFIWEKKSSAQKYFDAFLM